MNRAAIETVLADAEAMIRQAERLVAGARQMLIEQEPCEHEWVDNGSSMNNPHFKCRLCGALREEWPEDGEAVLD